MKDKIDKIKVLFADVDNTLLRLKMYDQEGKRIIGVLDADKWLQYNIQTNAYEKCTAPKGMENIVNGLHFGNDVKVYGLTECSNSFEYNAKYNRLVECYPGVFKHHGDLISTESRHKKVMIMNMICERDGLNPEEVMFIDDSHMEVMEAFEAGYFAMHTTEALDLFANPENEIIKELTKKENQQTMGLRKELPNIQFTVNQVNEVTAGLLSQLITQKLRENDSIGIFLSDYNNNIYDKCIVSKHKNQIGQNSEYIYDLIMKNHYQSKLTMEDIAKEVMYHLQSEINHNEQYERDEYLQEEDYDLDFDEEL